MIESFFIGILIFLAYSAMYAGILFYISKVSFLGMTIPTFLDAFHFSVALSIFSVVFATIIGFVYLAVRKPTLLPPDPKPVRLFLISFLFTFATWVILDLLYTSISIPLWVLCVFSLIMSVSNFKKLLKSIYSNEEDTPSKVNEN